MMAWKDRLFWPFALLVLIWIVQGLNLLTGYALNGMFGLLPRQFGGLDGVVLMPVLHGSISHAAANSVPLVVLGALMAVSAQRKMISATVIIVICGGLGVWVFGASALHIGASGLIFGWFGFLLARGWFDRQLVPVLVAVGVAVLYGAFLWGMLPGQPGVSWEAHLFGFLAGVFAAYLLRRAQ